jgi:NAD(P)H-quinone oxidoreductase subunit I
MAKGMALTLKHTARRPITTQYPEEKLNVSRRFRGYELVWYEDKCTGCATCAKSCPQGNIEIVTAKEGDHYKVLNFEVDTGRCMACGLCVEACPYQALYMGRGYERACYRRREVVLTKEDLKPSPKRQPSGYANTEVAEQLPEQTLLVYRK